jgi:hypothetical protein
MLAVLAIGAASAFACLKHSESKARELLQALASLDLSISSTTDVQLLQQCFHRYQVSDEDSNGVRGVRFEISNDPFARLALRPVAVLSAGIGTRDGKVVGVSARFERQDSHGNVSAIVYEDLQQSGFCRKSYCVGNPIGKPFVISRLDPRATREQKKRAFDLNLDWLTRFTGEARICDLSPNAWADWKAQTQRPDDVAALQATYHCP